MSKRTGTNRAPPPISHETAMTWLLDYYYHRLAPARDATLEAHARSCVQCRAEGLGHLATERMQAMRQRSRARQPVTTPLTISLSILLALFVVFAVLLFYVIGRDGAARTVFGSTTTAQSGLAQVPTVAATATTAPTPVALKAAATVGGANSVTLAASPDGTQMAVATNMTGVEIYKNGKAMGHLSGFEGFNAPGAMAWSVDGRYLAAAGGATLFIWQVSTGDATPIRLKTSPGTDLYIFDWAGNKLIGSYPVTLFATSGLAQWGEKGQIQAAPAGSAGAGNIPGASSPIFALWSGQQGTRLFRDATANTLQVGTSDGDVAAHAAMLRWSPDDRYILWGYPRLPISASLVGSPAGSIPNGTVGSPNPAFAQLVNRNGAATDAAATIVIWPAPDGQSLAYADSSVNPTALAIANSQTTAALYTLPSAVGQGHAALGTCAWEAAGTLKMVCTNGTAPANEYVPGP